MNWTARNIPAQNGRVAVVTGANSGIGWHTALELARAGAEVILTARSQAKGDTAAEGIRRQVPGAKVRTEILDLASLRSVQEFAARLNAEPKIDLLVNNAGVMAIPERQLTAEGFEMQFGTNYLGPFALTLLLFPALRRSNAPRVTTVCSGAANLGLRRIQFEDLQWEKAYGPWKAYCQSKLADVLFMLELSRRCEQAGIGVVSNGAHPGYARTNLQTSGPGRPQNVFEKLLAAIMSQDAAQGALPTLRAATAADAGSGSYYGPSLFQLKGLPVAVSIPKPARDAEAARKLWEISEELTGARWSAAAAATASVSGR